MNVANLLYKPCHRDNKWHHIKLEFRFDYDDKINVCSVVKFIQFWHHFTAYVNWRQHETLHCVCSVDSTAKQPWKKYSHILTNHGFCFCTFLL